MEIRSINSQSTLASVDFDPFAAGELLLTAPATHSQTEIWASVQMGSAANCAYNESQSLRFTGELNVNNLQIAIQQLVNRHEALRTTFSTDGQTLCIVATRVHETPLVDLTELAPSAQTKALAEILEHEVKQPFDLEHGPLFRSQIIKFSDVEYQAILTAHHIICDGWSWGVMMPDLGKLYSALQQGIDLELDDVDNFSEYAIAQADTARDEETLETESYWLEQFADKVPIVDFPTDRSRPPLRTFDAARVDWDLSPELVTNLKQLGTSKGCSLMTVMLAGFEVWLHRLTGQTDLVVGIPAAGQAASGQYNLVGHCVNLLPLRTQIDRDKTFSSYLQARSSTILDAYDRQQFTFGSLLSKLNLARDASRIPLVPITFNIDRGLTADSLPFTDLTVQFSTNPRAFENFELFINATELNGKITLECQYNCHLFDAETIERRMTEFETLLLGIVANSDTTIATLPILPTVETQLFNTWAQTTTNYPQQCIHQLFEAQVERTPDAIALVFNGETLTYQELNTRSNHLATYLNAKGVTTDALVGICMERSIEMVVSLLAILKAGGAYVPLDPAYPLERLAFMLSDTQLELLLTQSTLVEKIPTNSATVICVDTDWEKIAQTRSDHLTNLSNLDNLAYVMYTSGSTGQPKGVSIPHRGVVRLVTETNYVSLTAVDVFLQLSPISFDAATFELWGCLLNGGKLVIFPPHTPSLDELEQIIQQDKVTIMWLTAGLFHLMVDEKIDAFKPLRQLLAGGDVLSVPHVQKFLDTVPTCQLINGYGPTENTTFTCCHQITAPLTPGASIPIGKPISNTQVYILDDRLQPVPIGIAGELYIGGDGLARDYFQRPDLTSDRFIANPFFPKSRLYKSGDLARYLPTGEIEYLGRIDYQVKVSGFRIELGEIEAALLRYPAIKEAIAVVREDTNKKVLAAYFSITSDTDRSSIVSEVRKFLKQQLPEFMQPASFMVLETMPLTPNGKIDRQALPQPELTIDRQKYIAPTTPVERQIADIWAQVLKLERVGIHDNFFELGGYSLVGIQAIAKLRQSLQVELLMSNLFELPTVAELADRVENLRWVVQGLNIDRDDPNDDYEEGEL